MIIPNDNGFFENFSGHDRFDVPIPLYRVTGGQGGEAYLIIGSEKTALYDVGMACFSEELISNIHEVLDKAGKSLDYILLSHTHYDHIGALPYVLREWKDAVVCGAKKCASVFASDTALNTMTELSKNAALLYGKDSENISSRGMRLDKALSDGDSIELGEMSVYFYETKGHTDCSGSYMLMPQAIVFASESIGLVDGPGRIRTSCLKSFAQSIESSKKIRELKPKRIIPMHYGILPESYNEDYFDDFIEEALWEWGLIRRAIKNGKSDEEISDLHDAIYWNEALRLNQPYDAHHLNTLIIIKNVRKDES